MRLVILACLLLLDSSAYATLVGGRLNAYSEGQNAFAGVINPANAVWIADRVDIGAYWQHQKSSLDNKNDNPGLPPGKTDFTYRSKDLFTADIAGHKHFDIQGYDSSISLATYTTPSVVKLRTKIPLPLSGTTPMIVRNKTEVLSAVLSVKLNTSHSIGISLDYFLFSHKRNGFQKSDNALRSVSPGHVTNNGTDRSGGLGFSIGWRWNITERLFFGTAWTSKSYCGQYRKYRGYEPHHAKNYTPQLVGAGFSYRFNSTIAGRIEVLWTNNGNLPSSNNNVLPNGLPNLHKRGSTKSPGPGAQDATFINVGLGYKVSDSLSIGGGLSHRIKLHQSKSNFLSHTYVLQTIYDIISLGTSYKCGHHDLFLGFTHGLKNRVSRYLPLYAGGGKVVGEKQTSSLSFSWGYRY